MTIDQHIEELRAELKACCEPAEITVIDRELAAALTERKRLESEAEVQARTMP